MKSASFKSTQRERLRHSEMCDTHHFSELVQAATAISFTDPAAIVAMAPKAPVSAAREAQTAMRTLDTGFNKHRIGIIGAGYASAYHMMRTEGAWERFIKESGWDDLTNRPKNNLRARNNILLHVLRYVFRAEGETARRRVRVYAGMLQDRFNKGFKPEDVIPLINRRGIEALRQEGVALRRSGVRDTYFDDLNDIDDQNSGPNLKRPQTQWRNLTSGQVARCKAALATFNAELMRYLEEHAQQAAPTRGRALIE